MRMIAFKGYQICILDLICDHKTGKMDSGKIWFWIANVIESRRIIFSVNVEWMEILIYLAVVGGSNVAMQAMKWKFRDGNNTPAGDPCVDQK